MSGKAVRNIRKIEKPRPLRLNSDGSKPSLQSPTDNIIRRKSTSDILADLEALHVSVSNYNFDEATAADISKLCSILKLKGEELDVSHKDQLDRFFITLRNASREDRLDMVSRMKLLEIIEMRGMRWQVNENVSSYYKAKIFELEQGIDKMTVSCGGLSPNIPYLPIQTQVPAVNAVPLAPGEILRSSGKFTKPTKIIGKNYVKDEIIIRNSDSGKVMGIKGRRVHMIEELSDTVISFQRVNPGARDRLVQITGPHEEAIGHAKILVEDTIRRNASPVREKGDFLETDGDINSPLGLSDSYALTENQAISKNQLAHSLSMSDASMGEYSLPIHVGRDVIKLSGAKMDLLKIAQSVLIQHFTQQIDMQEKQKGFTLSLSSPTNSHSTSFEENFHRYDLKKQSSLKNNNFQYLYSSPWIGQSSQKSSPSPFSSSEDENVKENLEENHTDIPFRSNMSFNAINDIKTQELTRVPAVSDFQAPNPTGSANFREKFTRSSSVPIDVFVSQNQNSSQNIRRFSNEQMEVPVIPPPCYRQPQYSREFLLTCAKSPLCFTKPANYTEILNNFREIICKSPVMFDPTRYLQRQSSKDREDRNSPS